MTSPDLETNLDAPVMTAIFFGLASAANVLLEDMGEPDPLLDTNLTQVGNLLTRTMVGAGQIFLKTHKLSIAGRDQTGFLFFSPIKSSQIMEEVGGLLL